jgi:hypothetical protein
LSLLDFELRGLELAKQVLYSLSQSTISKYWCVFLPVSPSSSSLSSSSFLGFELRASCLLGKLSAVWAVPPALFAITLFLR